MNHPLLVCSGLSKSFRLPDRQQVAAVSDAGLSVSRGQTVVICGPSGSGKTTLLMMAAGLLRPQSGTVLLGGQNIFAHSPTGRAELRRSKLGVILPMFHLLPYLDALANVSLAAPGTLGKQTAHRLLERVGLQDRARQLPDSMSAGERRRLMVARALVHQPELILADEPTTNLDSQSADIIRGLLHETAQNGTGLLIVTHESPELFHAEQVYEMRFGKLSSSQSNAQAGT